ncbi:MAG: DUF86 domain-containing protein [Rubrivivax sp.]|nr:DUF86 domain-containing protein [Rubrivivax sp.]
MKPPSGAYEMRNALAHGYFKIDLGVVWTTITNDLPALLSALRAVASAGTPFRQPGSR